MIDLPRNLPYHGIDPININHTIKALKSIINTPTKEASPPRKPNNNDNNKKHFTPWWNEECQVARKKITMFLTKPNDTL